MTEDCKTCINLEEHKSLSMSPPTPRIPQLELLERQLQAERAQQRHLQTLADQQSNPTRPHHVLFHVFPCGWSCWSCTSRQSKSSGIRSAANFWF